VVNTNKMICTIKLNMCNCIF